MQGSIPYNKPFLTGKELDFIKDAHARGQVAGDGHYTKACENLLEQKVGAAKALLVHSCTAALEMSAMLLDLSPGDEVILPSYTFVSTANAFALRGVIPVFADIKPETFNLDETTISSLITEKTRAIVPVHYAGVSCEMDSIMEIAGEHDLVVVEDAAQGLGASYCGSNLGTIGNLGTLSFHETKNIISGEGGALLINDPELIHKAEIIREKGTNRSSFFRGEVDKYTWVELGSSYLPGEIIAAFLFAQLSQMNRICHQRLKLWNCYHTLLQPLEEEGLLKRPVIPERCEHNGHIYYIVLPSEDYRDAVMDHLNQNGIQGIFHYVPLHSSPAGMKFGEVREQLPVTEEYSKRLLRLPLWVELEESVISKIVNQIQRGLERLK
jgi:dTDP-4-amino-4,6-dideoxygalactose transaminase